MTCKANNPWTRTLEELTNHIRGFEAGYLCAVKLAEIMSKCILAIDSTSYNSLYKGLRKYRQGSKVSPNQLELYSAIDEEKERNKRLQKTQNTP